MSGVTEANIIDALKQVIDPDRGADVVSLGMISEVIVKDGNVAIAIEIDPADSEKKEPLRQSCEDAVEALPGVLSATAVLTAERKAEEEAAEPAQDRGAGRPSRLEIPGVEAIIAVASGKGGVGKSTVAVNLAVALAAGGRRVGLLDADIYGPSIPRMMRIDGPPRTEDGKRLLPIENHGVKCMSIGFLVGEDTAMIWRGPMVMGAIEQMLRDVNWGELEVLVVDLPPGTGDAQLTLAQRVPLTGVVIVSTPQDVALTDVRRGIKMFRDVDVPVLGVIENMSYFVCPDCGHRSDVFNHGGARRTADELETDFLGEIPLDMAIRETSDNGEPIVGSRPESPQAEIYRRFAERVGDNIAEALSGGARAAPRMVIQ